MERLADTAADRFYPELVKTEGFRAFEALVAADMRRRLLGARAADACRELRGG